MNRLAVAIQEMLDDGEWHDLSSVIGRLNKPGPEEFAVALAAAMIKVCPATHRIIDPCVDEGKDYLARMEREQSTTADSSQGAA